ncbi:enteropeptidase, partial [Clarias magur]
SGNASFVSVVAEDAPFVVVTQAANGTVDVKPSETCPSNEAVSLHCNNQPCGKRKVVINTESGSSVVRESRVETEERTSEGVDGRIVGGEDAVKGAWPWIASLRFTGKQICAATIIDSQWLVTDAYSVYGKNIHLSNWTVVLGLHAQYESNTSDRQYHNVDQIVMNPNYNKRTKDSDIALMHLQDKITFTDYIQPICLPEPNQQFEAGRKCFIAGWGTLTEAGDSADVLQQAVVPLVNNSVCQERLPMYKITEQMVCAGYPEGGIDSCE